MVKFFHCVSIVFAILGLSFCAYKLGYHDGSEKVGKACSTKIREIEGIYKEKMLMYFNVNVE